MTGAVSTARRALVTGGSGGVGMAICQRLARAGHHVYVHAHRGREAAQALVEQLTGDGLSAQALYFDVTDAAAHAVAARSTRLMLGCTYAAAWRTRATACAQGWRPC